VVEQQREQKPEDELSDDRRTDDEHDRIEDNGREVGIADEALVVVEADEAWAGGVEADERFVREARVQRPERGADEKERKEDGRRRQARQIRAVAA
jgi:hypothetical protein